MAHAVILVEQIVVRSGPTTIAWRDFRFPVGEAERATKFHPVTFDYVQASSKQKACSSNSGADLRAVRATIPSTSREVPIFHCQ